MFIYKLTNTINNKIYIGLTTEKSVKERCRKRDAEAKYRSERSSYMLNAIRKYGSHVFSVEQIDIASSLEELKEKEIYYIKLYNATDRTIGYNLTEGGEGNKGLKMSDVTKDKIRKAHLGKSWSEERKLKHSEDLKLKNLDYSKGTQNCKKHNLRTSKKIDKFDLNGNKIDTYNSISELTVKENIDRSGISKYLSSDKAEKNITYKGSIYRLQLN